MNIHIHDCSSFLTLFQFISINSDVISDMSMYDDWMNGMATGVNTRGNWEELCPFFIVQNVWVEHQSTRSFLFASPSPLQYRHRRQPHRACRFLYLNFKLFEKRSFWARFYSWRDIKVSPIMMSIPARWRCLISLRNQNQSNKAGYLPSCKLFGQSTTWKTSIIVDPDGNFFDFWRGQVGTGLMCSIPKSSISKMR